MDGAFAGKLALDAKALDADIQSIKVALAELDSMKPRRQAYLQRGNLFFLTKPEIATRAKEDELEAKQAKRREVGLKRAQL
ncbi:hypothetical protein H310_06525 [Aphanomyces invadans]|uniref:Prefoldin subunit 1 n=1 Tax=Aphanomyces invadans TaxID=157072 RepID=A0A024U7Z6_9STRA|nr:hypothetical protein H310_06525 [Aphanomyces invadans]ETW02007.1 hypothetical protein H310_06525 [Aphanomyces invadans]|eukprot:XP_008869855.1 hypothetical protein H310_06525 [Aphanomyces invadans]